MVKNSKFLLYFDGATSGGNEGTGGCGAYWYKNPYSTEGDMSGTPEHVHISRDNRAYRKLGNVSNTEAKYCGLILGLRGLLRDYPIPTFDLLIFGDSELVIQQFSAKGKIRSPALKIYHEIAVGLMGKIKGKVQMTSVTRDENMIAAELAKRACKKSLDVGDFIEFCPERIQLYDIKLKGGRVLVSGMDNIKAPKSPEIIFDATTIAEIFGKEIFQTLVDPGRTTILKSKKDEANMTILGILREPIKCSINLSPEREDLKVTLEDIVVVDSLPYDAQISFDHPMMKAAVKEQLNDIVLIGIASDGPIFGHRFNSDVLDERFKSHPFWTW